MFKVQANSLDEYFEADHARKADLQAMDALIREKGALGELRRAACVRARQRW
jgi:hypothetical protein